MKEDLIPRAFSFAYHAHQNSSRKGSKIPYITHPLDVASILMRCNVSDSLIAAALLHDVVEDEEVTYEELENLFGVKIKNLIKVLTEYIISGNIRIKGLFIIWIIFYSKNAF